MKGQLVAAIVCCAPVAVLAQTAAEQVAERTNIARWEEDAHPPAGPDRLPPLKLVDILTAPAQLHSNNMAVRNFFMHCDPDTRTTPFDRMEAAGYDYTGAAENIAAGRPTANQTVEQWLASPGHFANIMRPEMRELGVGHAFQSPDQNNVRTGGTQNDCFAVTASNGFGYQHYWTQKFGVRSGEYPLVIAREAYEANDCLIDVYVYGSGFATQMRFSNDGNTWSAWEPYSPDTLRPLEGIAGERVTLHSQIRNAQGSVRSAQDAIVLGEACSNGAPDPDALFADGFEP